MRGPITQASPPTLNRGGLGSRKYARVTPEPGSGRNKIRKLQMNRKKPDPKSSEIIEGKPVRETPNTQKKWGKNNRVGEAKISYPRLRSDIHLGCAGPPRAVVPAKCTCRHQELCAARVGVVHSAPEKEEARSVRPWSSQKLNRIYPIRRCSCNDFPKPPQTVAALVPKVSPVGKHGGAVSNPIGGRQGRHGRVPGNARCYSEKAPAVCRANSYPAVQAVGSAVLVWGWARPSSGQELRSARQRCTRARPVAPAPGRNHRTSILRQLRREHPNRSLWHGRYASRRRKSFERGLPTGSARSRSDGWVPSGQPRRPEQGP